MINLDPLHQGTTKAIPQQKSVPSQLLKSAEQDNARFPGAKPKTKKQMVSKPSTNPKMWNKLHSHTYKLYTCIYKHISTYQNDRYTRKIIVTSISIRCQLWLATWERPKFRSWDFQAEALCKSRAQNGPCHNLSSNTQLWLVVSTHLKNISQIGNLPQVGVKIKKCLKPPPRQLN